MSRAATSPYDLLIRGGRVIDPAAGLDGIWDIAIQGGKVAAVDVNIPSSRAAQTLDATGKLVLPGLVDLHIHGYWGYHGAEPDTVCLPRGTTTAVDGGSVGANGFPGFKRYVVEQSRTRVLSWLNISTVGLIEVRVGELSNLLYLDVDAAVRTAEAHPDAIVGFKVRLSEYVCGADFRPALKLARQAADAAGIPLMVHIGDTDHPLPVALGFLKPGDVVTHTFSGRRHGILDYQGRVWDAVREAQANGIIFDGAHGRRHFGFEVARRAYEQGFQLDTMSSDVSARAVRDTTYHLPLLMSKLLALGATLEEVVPLVTSRPAAFLGRQEGLGTLRPGAEGDIAILDLLKGEFMFRDNEGQTLQAEQRLRPWRTLKAGAVIDAPPDC